MILKCDPVGLLPSQGLLTSYLDLVSGTLFLLSIIFLLEILAVDCREEGDIGTLDQPVFSFYTDLLSVEAKWE